MSGAHLSALALAAVALGGCGGEPAAPEPTPADPVTTTLRETLAAVAEADGARACSQLTPRARERVEEAARRRLGTGGSGCERAAAAAVRRLPAIALGALRNPSIYDVRVSGERATAAVEPPPDVRQLAAAAGGDFPLSAEVRLVRAGGRWLIDDAAAR